FAVFIQCFLYQLTGLVKSLVCSGYFSQYIRYNFHYFTVFVVKYCLTIFQCVSEGYLLFKLAVFVIFFFFHRLAGIVMIDSFFLVSGRITGDCLSLRHTIFKGGCGSQLAVCMVRKKDSMRTPVFVSAFFFNFLIRKIYFVATV